MILADTITKLPPEAEGAVIVSGSHGGRYPGQLAAKAGARAVILNDGGVGRDALRDEDARKGVFVFAFDLSRRQNWDGLHGGYFTDRLSGR